ncbi:basic helix-loop-helix (bHLH) DNA-bindingsuperfamily protein [Striga asiatica]|uniref:Basic helix-loop-helix (BHLH) DNA-bindingsuperfamily protein n=1 Tax=Striga asiatica TaxID=4170 RepID=A0A5A7QIE4_STRAF|nr:basic helix-loop-helix (bHLH) DNA-bindingsuperfamily protein [Striga asiatica]
MYEENTVFDQTCNLHEGDGFPQSQNPNFPIHDQHEPSAAAAAISAMEMEFQNQIAVEMEHCYTTAASTAEIQQIVQEMSGFGADYSQNGHFAAASSTAHHDLLNIFPPPPPSICSTFSGPTHRKSPSFLASLGLLGDLNNPTADVSGPGGAYDSLPLNLPPQPPMLRDLFHSGAAGSFFGGVVDERDIGGGGGGVFYPSGENGVFEFAAAGEIDCLGKNRDGKGDTKHFATERHRRVLLNDKYQALRKLVANPTKNDRASIVGDAIDYINELKRSVAELKLLVEKKRCARERLKRLKTEENHNHANNNNNSNDNNNTENDSKPLLDLDHPCNGSGLRSSWLHRKSKNTEVDVRIIDDEVTVKVVQQKRINCLLFVSKVLDELQLDLHHVAGGLIGDYYSFLFNSKICEGSIVYASAIANKLIEVVDKHYAAAAPPTNSY